MSNAPQKLSRRGVLVLLIAATVAFGLRIFRGIDVASVVQDYFGFREDYRSLIRRRFDHLKVRNPVLYRDSVLFFTLRFIPFPGRFRTRVLTHWISFLFEDRSRAWPYVNYPSVGEYQICNGLIRKT
jgi:hypothetical protein